MLNQYHIFWRSLLLCLVIILSITNSAIGQDTGSVDESSSSSIIDILIFLVVCIIAISFFFFLINLVGKKKSVPKSPSISIKDFPASGTGRIIGKVVSVAVPLIAPISGKPCVAFQANASVFQGVDEEAIEQSAFVNIASEKDHITFFVKDETGLAEIKINGGDFDLNDYKRWKTGLTRPMNSRMKTFLRKHGNSAGLLTGIGTTYKFQETIIEVGHNLSIEGQGKWEETIDLNHKNAHPKVLVFEHSNQNPLNLTIE